MKKITRIILASLLAATMAAAVAGCNKSNNEESSKASSVSSGASSTETSAASVVSGSESSTVESSEESSKSDTESSAEESSESAESTENSEGTESSAAESSESEDSSSEPISDTVSQDEAQKILLKFLNADSEGSTLNARYVETVTVNVDNTDKYFMEFDVRLNNGVTNSHVDYYYVACSRTDGGVYDSESFEATYGYKRATSDESSEESTESAESTESTESEAASEDYSLPSDEITEEEAKDLLLGYLGGDNLIAVSKGKTTVDNNGEAVEYYIFDISSGDENSSTHIDDYYIINSRFGGGIYDSMTFKSRFKTS